MSESGIKPAADTPIWVIEDWALCGSGLNVYQPPEVRGICVTGKCPSRAGFEHGILTSRIVRIKGSHIWTETGSHYILGKPGAAYVKLCRERGWRLPTEKEPIRVHN